MRKFVIKVGIMLLLSSCTNIPVSRYSPNFESGYPDSYYRSDTLLLSELGYDENDSTDILQKALDSEYHTIVIPVKPGPWITRPLFINRDNITIIFEKGAQLIAKRGSYRGRGDSLLSIDGVQNISIDGYGGIIRMWRDDYDKKPYEHSEWRSGIKILSSDNIKIAGLTIQGTGGDGIYISQLHREDYPLYSSHVVIKDMQLIDNYRQGISVISVRNLLIDNCYIYGTKGTPPEAGIDFEPNRAMESLVNCQVINSQITHNNGAGILIWLKSLDSSSTPIEITIEKCTIYKNGWGLGLYMGGLNNNPTGNLFLKNNEIRLINLLPARSVDIHKL